MQINLSDGRILTATERHFKGMAGETVTVIHCVDQTGKYMNTTDVKSQCSDEDQEILLDWEYELSKLNKALAIQHII